MKIFTFLFLSTCFILVCMLIMRLNELSRTMWKTKTDCSFWTFAKNHIFDYRDYTMLIGITRDYMNQMGIKGNDKYPEWAAHIYLEETVRGNKWKVEDSGNCSRFIITNNNQ